MHYIQTEHHVYSSLDTVTFFSILLLTIDGKGSCFFYLPSYLMYVVYNTLLFDRLRLIGHEPI